MPAPHHPEALVCSSMAADCNCALLALRILARVEVLTAKPKLPLDAALQLTEEAESRSLAVLSCETCGRQRLALTSITVLSTCLVDWLRRTWQLRGDDEEEDDNKNNKKNNNNNSNTSNTNNANDNHRDCPAQPRKLSLGSYDLDPDEADLLIHELMTLRLTRFSAVLGSLEAALLLHAAPSSYCSSTYSSSSSYSSAHASTSSSVTGTIIASACLDLVRSNLRLLRACIRRLKACSLLSGSNPLPPCSMPSFPTAAP